MPEKKSQRAERFKAKWAEANFKDVHKPRKEYSIWLNFGYVVVYPKILRLDFSQIFYHVVW